MTVLHRFIRMLSALLATGAQKQPDHITRYTMYRRIERDFPPVHGRTLAISRSRNLADRFGVTGEVVEADWPEHDITDLKAFGDGSFDCVVSDQVLEHVRDPLAALSETMRVLRSGGVFLHTTCFINPVHEAPQDFWRFTPAGLAELCERVGAEPLAIEGWGNPGLWVAVALGLRFTPIPERRWHPLHVLAVWNHPNWPVSTWALGRRR